MHFIEQSLFQQSLPSVLIHLSHPNTFHDNNEVEIPVREWLKMQGYVINIKKISESCKIEQIYTVFWHQYRVLCIIYNLTNDWTIISNTIITNSMLLHVSTFKMSSSGSSLRLALLAYTATTQTFYYAVQSTFYWSLSIYILTNLF